MSKSIDELKAAPVKIQCDMEDLVENYNYIDELKDDILKRFDGSPVLEAAIDRLIEFVEDKAQHEYIMREAGFTYEDALRSFFMETREEHERQQV